MMTTKPEEYILGQGEIAKFAILRNGVEINYPELVGTKNQVIQYLANVGAIGGGAGVDLSVTDTTIARPTFQALSGLYSYNATTNVLSGNPGSTSVDVERCLLVENGLVGQLNQTTNYAQFFTLTAAQPGRLLSSFVNQRIKMANFPNTPPAWGSGSLTYTLSASGQRLKSITATTNALVANKIIEGVMLGQVFGGNWQNTSTRAYVRFPIMLSALAGDQFVITYNYSVTTGGQYFGLSTAISDYVNGWPFRYPVTSITGNGSTVTVTVPATPKLHLIAGDTITIDAVPLRKAITSIVSDPTTWTVICLSHGLTTGNSITHENITNATYNGAYVVASTPDVNTYTVTNASNPGATTGGTVRLTTPSPYFSGEFVATSANSTQIQYASVVTGPQIDTSTARLTTPDRMRIYCNNTTSQNTVAYQSLWIQSESQAAAFSLLSSATHSPYNVLSNTGYLYGSSNTNNQSERPTLGINLTPTFGSGGTDGFNRIKRIINIGGQTSSNADGGTFIVLETPQVKHQGYSLTLESLRLPYLAFSEVPSYAAAI